ncbi:MAG: hypothetical protein ACXV5Q_17890 [Frankiaceae bacterium]
MPRVYRLARLIPVFVLLFAVVGGSAAGGSTRQVVRSAPWWVRRQGNRNVSPGCVDTSPANVAWLCDLSRARHLINVLNAVRPPDLAQGTVWAWRWQRLGRAARGDLPAGPVMAHPGSPPAWRP